MCICADNVKEVSNTKICSFHVGYSYDGGANITSGQLIVYSADVDSLTSSNAFILPVYNPGNNAYKIIPLDFSELGSFFYDVDSIFEKWYPKMLSKGLRSFENTFDSTNSSPLKVHTVGDYKFSIMPSKKDFNRIDRSILNVNPSAKVSIDVHTNDYSFIVCQFFQSGKLNISPFAYLCQAASDYTQVVPTIHGHPHDEIEVPGMRSMFFSHKPNFEEKSDFDHTIYCLVKQPNVVNPVVGKNDVKDFYRLLKEIKMDYKQKTVAVYPPNNFVPLKFEIKGYKTNRNIAVGVNGMVFLADLELDKQ